MAMPRAGSCRCRPGMCRSARPRQAGRLVLPTPYLRVPRSLCDTPAQRFFPAPIYTSKKAPRRIINRRPQFYCDPRGSRGHRCGLFYVLSALLVRICRLLAPSCAERVTEVRGGPGSIGPVHLQQSEHPSPRRTVAFLRVKDGAPKIVTASSRATGQTAKRMLHRPCIARAGERIRRGV